MSMHTPFRLHVRSQEPHLLPGGIGILSLHSGLPPSRRLLDAPCQPNTLIILDRGWFVCPFSSSLVTKLEHYGDFKSSSSPYPKPRSE